MPKIEVKGLTVQTGERPQANTQTDGRTLPNVLSPLLLHITTSNNLAKNFKTEEVKQSCIFSQALKKENEKETN